MVLALEMERILRNMSRYDKYGIGKEIRKSSLVTISFKVRINLTDKKKEDLEEIWITIEELKQLVFLRLISVFESQFHVNNLYGNYLNYKKGIWKIYKFRVNSYLDYISHSNSYSLKNHIPKVIFPYRVFIDFHNGYIRAKSTMYYKYLNFKSQISFYRKEFSEHTIIIKKWRFYEIIGRDDEESERVNRLNLYYKKRKREYGIRTNSIRNILYNMRVYFMSGILIRPTGEITNKIKARIHVISWKLLKPAQLALFIT